MRHRLPLVAGLVSGAVVACSAIAARAQTSPQPPAGAAAAAPAPISAAADALSEAARKGDAAAVTRQLDAGVDVNTLFRYNRTALSFACDRGHLEVVRVLLARGADPNVKDSFYGATPLSWASRPAQTRKPEHATIVGLLLKAGARGKEDALMAAVGEGDEPMTRVVLAHGGLSPATLSDAIEAATREKQSAIVAALEGAGAKPWPVVTLTEAQLARCAGAYAAGPATLTFAVRDGKLQGGPPGQNLTLVARSDTTFAVADAPGLSIAFALAGDRATSATVTRGGTPTVYTRVEGK
jgi:ankyrin repeat protein